MRTNTVRHVPECADVKTSAKLEKGVRRGRDGTLSLPVFQTPSQRGPCMYSEKVSGESHVTQDGGVLLLKIEVGNICIHSYYIRVTQRVPPAGITLYDFVQDRQVAEGWE